MASTAAPTQSPVGIVSDDVKWWGHQFQSTATVYFHSSSATPINCEGSVWFTVELMSSVSRIRPLSSHVQMIPNASELCSWVKALVESNLESFLTFCLTPWKKSFKTVTEKVKPALVFLQEKFVWQILYTLLNPEKFRASAPRKVVQVELKPKEIAINDSCVRAHTVTMTLNLKIFT